MSLRNSTAPEDIGLWFVGVGLNLMASFLVTVGMMLQKLVHNRLSLEGKAAEVSFYTQPLWVFGLVLMVSEVIIDLATFGLAPVSILAPLSSVVLVWNVLLAPVILGEQLSRIQIAATGIILIGAILAVAFAEQSTPTYEIEDVESFMTSPLFVVFEIAIVAVLVNLHFALQIKDAQKRAEDHNETQREDYRKSQAALVAAGENVDLEADPPSHLFMTMDEFLNSKCFKYLCACYTQGLIRLTLWFFGPGVLGDYGLTIAYAFMTASLSGQSVGAAKLAIELVKTSALGGSTLFYEEWLWYVILIWALLSTLLMLRYLNEMLARFEALVAVPIYQALLVIMQLGTAAFLFNEFASFAVLQIVFFPIGTLVCILGIIVLSKAQRQEVLKEFNNDDVEVSWAPSFTPRVDVRRPSIERLRSRSEEQINNT